LEFLSWGNRRSYYFEKQGGKWDESRSRNFPIPNPEESKKVTEGIKRRWKTLLEEGVKNNELSDSLLEFFREKRGPVKKGCHSRETPSNERGGTLQLRRGKAESEDHFRNHLQKPEDKDSDR